MVIANNYPKTLKQIEKYYPDIIITNLNLSNSSFNLINKVKTKQENEQIPIIVMSKAGQERFGETSFELGAEDNLSHYNKLQELSLRINILAR